MWKQFVAFFLLLPLAAAEVRGAYRFVVNDEREKCAAFWPGDDWEYYELDEGWHDYEEGKVAHDFWNTTYWCERIGYTYIGEITGPRHERLVNPASKRFAAGLFSVFGTIAVVNHFSKKPDL